MKHYKWDTSQKIIRAYEELKQELGRVPTSWDFIDRYGGAISAIRNRNVIRGVTTWNGFVRYMGDKTRHNIGKWDTPKKIMDVYEACKKELGRVPTYDDFKVKYRGALKAIHAGNTLPGITTWNGFLRYMGEHMHNEIGKWNTPEKIARAYEECKKELGRVPTSEEFNKKYSGAIVRITRGKVIPGVKTWNDLLRYMGDKINQDKGRWDTSQKIIRAYEELKQELGKVPTQEEFNKRYSGAFSAISRGRKIPNVSTWNGFLRYMGDKPNKQWKNPVSLLESLLDDDDKNKAGRR